MRLSVFLPSRERPFGLRTAAASLCDTASGKHDIRFLVGCDSDDPHTIATAWTLRLRGLPVYPFVAKRQGSLGQLINLMSLEAPADVYTSLADDIECTTHDWDDIIARAWQAKPDGIWWWGCPSGTTFSVISEKWRAAAGRIFTDYFPYWWDDMWLLEVYRYASGEGGDYLKRLDCELVDKAESTMRMRDLPFWTDFFWSRRPERIEEARRIRQTLGWRKVRDLSELHLKVHPDFSAEKVEAKQGEKGPPTPEYVRAKARAEAMMMERKAA